MILGFVLGIVSGFLANYITPALTSYIAKKISSIFYRLNPDSYDLSGTWEQTFREPKSENPTEWVEECENIKLDHMGQRISGTGQTKGLHRIFDYDLKVKHNMVFGPYVKKGEKGNITGSGMIQLIVSPNRLTMQGQETWFDNDTNKIESSESTWKKIA